MPDGLAYLTLTLVGELSKVLNELDVFSAPKAVLPY